MMEIMMMFLSFSPFPLTHPALVPQNTYITLHYWWAFPHLWVFSFTNSELERKALRFPLAEKFDETCGGSMKVIEFVCVLALQGNELHLVTQTSLAKIIQLPYLAALIALVVVDVTLLIANGSLFLIFYAVEFCCVCCACCLGALQSRERRRRATSDDSEPKKALREEKRVLA